MKQIPYICNHCHHKFEAEEQDVLECPNCYWSSSVVKASEATEEKPILASKEVPTKKRGGSFSISGLLLKLLTLCFFLIIIAGLAFLCFRAFEWMADEQQEEPMQEVVLQEKSQDIFDETMVPAQTLSVEEKNILDRRLQMQPNRNPSEGEQKVLGAQAEFKTGFVQKLPSQAWTLEGFQKMVSEQETLYKIPFPKSYKKKLNQLIEEKYLPGAAAFEQGDILRARNLWVESLIFPLYGKDIQKHRAVAMTMVRPFINDTISKIAALNTMLIESGVREREQAISVKYFQLHETLASKNWDLALQKILELDQQIAELARPDLFAKVPIYPQTIRQVDRDLQIPLMELLASPTPPVSDLEPLKRDLEAKKKTLQGLRPASLATQQKIYDDAISALGREEWELAKNLLMKIDYPESLVEDAREKVRIIKKYRYA